MSGCLYDPGPLDLTWKAGDDEELVINYLDGDGNPVDLTGATIKTQLRLKPTSAVVELEMIATWDPSGQMVFTAAAADTRSLLPSGNSRKYVYDIEILDSNSKTTTIASGTVTVTADVTR